MKKTDYLDELKQELKKKNVADMDDILSEYAQHFAFKLADGFSEEEIAAKLGAPQTIATQFESIQETGKPKAKGGFLTMLGLSCAAVFETLFYLLLLAWNLVLGAATLGVATIGVCLAGYFNINGLIPNMPYPGSLLMGVSVLGLAVLLAAATVYCFAFLRQLIRVSVRWHQNVAGAALPPLPKNPQFRPRTRRTLRSVMLWALLVFGILFVVALGVLMLEAGVMGFWHHWNWFV